MTPRERMTASGGGRIDPNKPHQFVLTPTDNDYGGVTRASLACGACGGAFSNPVHPGKGRKVQRPIERHGPFGE